MRTEYLAMIDKQEISGRLFSVFTNSVTEFSSMDELYRMMMNEMQELSAMSSRDRFCRLQSYGKTPFVRKGVVLGERIIVDQSNSNAMQGYILSSTGRKGFCGMSELQTVIEHDIKAVLTQRHHNTLVYKSKAKKRASTGEK